MAGVHFALWLNLVLVAGTGLAQAADCTGDPGPRAAVIGYLSAMQEKRFEDAYDHVTATMTDARPREEWAGLQRKMFELGGVSLGDPDVRAVHRAKAADGSCATTAKVPNVLRAQDVLNNQGSTEFEVYTVVLQDGTWRIDAQETLFDEAAIKTWFPEDTVPEYKGTAPTGAGD